ncbi:MAG: hypothetical protein ACE5SW_01970 [Nitrososphaeraceae archaeon]
MDAVHKSTAILPRKHIMKLKPVTNTFVLRKQTITNQPINHPITLAKEQIGLLTILVPVNP